MLVSASNAPNNHLYGFGEVCFAHFIKNFTCMCLKEGVRPRTDLEEITCTFTISNRVTFPSSLRSSPVAVPLSFRLPAFPLRAAFRHRTSTRAAVRSPAAPCEGRRGTARAPRGDAAEEGGNTRGAAPANQTLERFSW